jgi:hypothetical protein
MVPVEIFNTKKGKKHHLCSQYHQQITQNSNDADFYGTSITSISLDQYLAVPLRNIWIHTNLVEF